MRERRRPTIVAEATMAGTLSAESEITRYGANPQADERELALIYKAKGLNEAHAEEVAARIMQDKEGALDTLVREELGVDPKELGDSGWEAAVASFLLFAVGAILPVAPTSSWAAWVPWRPAWP